MPTCILQIKYGSQRVSSTGEDPGEVLPKAAYNSVDTSHPRTIDTERFVTEVLGEEDR
jgi:hypothetical protein